MSKNKLTDLNDHLFMQLERLGEEGLEGERLEQEIKRADAIATISEQVVANADLHLRAAKLVAEHGAPVSSVLPMIGAEKPGGATMKGITFTDKEDKPNG